MNLQEKHYQLVHKGDSTISPDELSEQATAITKEYMKGFAEWKDAEGWVQAETYDTWRNVINHKIPENDRKTTSELIELYLKETESK